MRDADVRPGRVLRVTRPCTGYLRLRVPLSNDPAGPVDVRPGPALALSGAEHPTEHTWDPHVLALAGGRPLWVAASNLEEAT